MVCFLHCPGSSSNSFSSFSAICQNSIFFVPEVDGSKPSLFYHTFLGWLCYFHGCCCLVHFTNLPKYPTWINSSIYLFRTMHSSVACLACKWNCQYLVWSIFREIFMHSFGNWTISISLAWSKITLFGWVSGLRWHNGTKWGSLSHYRNWSLLPFYVGAKPIPWLAMPNLYDL